MTLQLWIQQSYYQPHCSVVNAVPLKQESKIDKKIAMIYQMFILLPTEEDVFLGVADVKFCP